MATSDQIGERAGTPASIVFYPGWIIDENGSWTVGEFLLATRPRNGVRTTTPASLCKDAAIFRKKF